MKRIIIIYCIMLASLGNGYSQDFQELEKYYYIIVGENVNIRMEPDKNSKIIAKLDIASKVKIIKKSNKIVKIGDIEGEWLYIDSCYYKKGELNDTIKGWVFSYYLAPVGRFKKVNSICEFEIQGWVGDYLLSYIVKNNGTYKRKVYNYDRNIYDSNIYGEIYSYRNVILAKDKNRTGFELFYFADNMSICSTYIDMYGKKICAKCK